MCEPVGAIVRCLADHMEAVFSNKHIFVDVNQTNVNQDESRSWPGSCHATHAVESINGTYTVKIPLDDCGTMVTQADGILTFTNFITGKDDRMLVGGLVMSQGCELHFGIPFCSKSLFKYKKLILNLSLNLQPFDKSSFTSAGQVFLQ